MPVAIRGEQGGAEWEAQPPSEKSNAQELNAEDFYEVSASKEAIAVLFDLKTDSIMPLTESRAQWYTGHYYKCKKGKKPYLVRAIYGQGGTGRYTLSKIGTSLWVMHGSLGAPAMHRSALIVNLDFEPTSVYVTRSIAR